MRTTSLSFSLVLFLACASSPHPAPLTLIPENPSTLATTPNKWTCASGHLDSATPSLLCVKPIMFGHDLYTLQLGGHTSLDCDRRDVVCLSAVDDEVARGITGEYRSLRATFRCVPETSKTSDGYPVEVARNCLVQVENRRPWHVMVTF